MKNKEVVDDIKKLASFVQRSKDLVEAAQVDCNDLFIEIHNSCLAFEKSLISKLPLELSLFERDWPDWQASWKNQKDILIQFGELHNISKWRGETPAKFGKRLLVELLKSPKTVSWRDNLKQQEKRKKDTFVKDPEAHNALKRWGQLSFEAFELDLKSTTPDLVKRSTEVLGISSKKKGKMLAKELHNASRRFANNTSIFNL